MRIPSETRERPTPPRMTSAKDSVDIFNPSRYTIGVKGTTTMTTDNYKFIVSRFTAESNETAYEEGEIGGGAFWTNRNIPVEGEFDTIAEALEAVCDKHCFDFHLNWWEYDELNEDFFTDVLVDNDNSEADEDDIALWKEGKKRLWNCRIHVKIVKQAIVQISEEEAKNFNKAC